MQIKETCIRSYKPTDTHISGGYVYQQYISYAIQERQFWSGQRYLPCGYKSNFFLSISWMYWYLCIFLKKKIFLILLFKYIVRSKIRRRILEQQSIFDDTIFIYDDVQLGYSLRCVVSPSNVQEGRRECHWFCESSEICDSATRWSCRSAMVCSTLV